MGIIFSGMMDEGTSGMWTLKRMGGLGIMQDTEDAICASMPSNVTEYVDVIYMVPKVMGNECCIVMGRIIDYRFFMLSYSHAQ